METALRWTVTRGVAIGLCDLAHTEIRLRCQGRSTNVYLNDIYLVYRMYMFLVLAVLESPDLGIVETCLQGRAF